MSTVISGTLFDPVKQSLGGARLAISETGVIEAVSPDSNPDKGFILPGFVDAHVHIESSMLTPSAFARAAVVHGTLAAAADPHEIANVIGKAGVELMLRLAAQTPFVFGFGVPSCVPATSFETAGADLGPEAVEELLGLPGITHLAEMMNVPGVLNHDPAVLAKLAAAHKRGLPADGHAPGLTGDSLRAYAAAGITTDHESLTLEEAREKIAAGMKIQIRYGSAARRFEEFLPLLADRPDMCMFCSDDKHPDDLLKDHINHIAAAARRAGIPLAAIVRAASVNPVRHYGLPLGLLQVGDSADFQIVDDLESFRPREVWLRGQPVARDGASLLTVGVPEILNHFAALPLAPEALRIPAESTRNIRVIGVHDGMLLTDHLSLAPTILGGAVVADNARDIIKLVVYNRYQPAPPAIGMIRGFGIKHGAIASSVAHDSHHIVAAGVTDTALASAINAVVNDKGGLAVAEQDGRILARLPLPLAGLMSPEPAEAAAHAYAQCDRRAKELGSVLAAPFMTLSFMALPVIPSLKLTDKGLFDGVAFRHVPLRAD
ncbi:MAG: adenine deaminase [Kiritimatiellae bacterium]|nr:adenine deaminase [Kiritimatiellia bacterium]